MVSAKANVASNKTVEYHLRRFQPGKMEVNRAVICLGKKGTGKSSLIEDIMWFQQNIPCGAIMSATEEANEAYAKMAPPLFIYKEFDADALLSIINRQKRMKKLYKENGDYLPFDHRAFVLLDDCMFDKKNFKGPLVRELFMNGRHWDLFVLITMQYIMDVTPEIRSNTDYLFALKENIRKNRERLHAEFFGMFPSFPVFDALYLEVCQDYRCLVLDNTIPSTNVEDCVFWYKAEKRPPFKLGAQWWWDFAARNTNVNGVNAKDSQQLEEMNKRAVRVVMEGRPEIQDRRPSPRRQEERVQFRRPSPHDGTRRRASPGGPLQPREYRQHDHQRDIDPPSYGYEFVNQQPSRRAPQQQRHQDGEEYYGFQQEEPPQRAAFSAPRVSSAARDRNW